MTRGELSMLAFLKNTCRKNHVPRLCLSVAIGCLMVMWHSSGVLAYKTEYVNCSTSSCPIPDMDVDGEQHGVVDGVCTNVDLPKIRMNCYYKNASTSGCHYVNKSVSEMTCSCLNDSLFYEKLKGTVTCSSE